MRTRVALVVAVTAGAVVGSASGIESTIVRGVGIGKVKVGMTRAQVKRLFGKDSIVNAHAKIGSAQYVELAWNFGSWSVGFLKHGSTYRVAQVATTLRGQRSTAGIGVGSTFKAVFRAYPQALCANYYPSMGSTATTGVGPGTRAYGAALIVAKDRKQMAFMVRNATNNSVDLTRQKPWVVYEVVVRNSIPGAVDFVPHERCQPGWQERGTPYEIR